MDPWPFVIGSYAVAAIGTVGLLAWTIAAMRKAERAADEIGRRGRGEEA